MYLQVMMCGTSLLRRQLFGIQQIFNKIERFLLVIQGTGASKKWEKRGRVPTFLLPQIIPQYPLLLCFHSLFFHRCHWNTKELSAEEASAVQGIYNGPTHPYNESQYWYNLLTEVMADSSVCLLARKSINIQIYKVSIMSYLLCFKYKLLIIFNIFLITTQYEFHALLTLYLSSLRQLFHQSH